MSKILINRKIVDGPWGGGNNFVKSLKSSLINNGHSLVDALCDDIDLIIMIDPRYDEARISINEIASYKRRNPRVKILHRINECDARKNTNEIDSLLLASNQLADKTVFISEWLKDYFIKRGFSKDSQVIYNGCNSDFFYPNHTKVIKAPYKIVTHHWSDNWMKGFDAYKRIDEICRSNPQKYQFTYIGRYAKEYAPQSTHIISPLYDKQLGEELRKHDIYVTASRWEPCGMHHIEGASSGLPVLYHSNGGGIVEGCKNHGLSFDSIDQIESKLDDLVNLHSSLMTNIDYKFLSIERCLSQYNDLINYMLGVDTR